MKDTSWVHAFVTDIGKTCLHWCCSGKPFAEKDGTAIKFDLTDGVPFPVVPDNPASFFSFTLDGLCS